MSALLLGLGFRAEMGSQTRKLMLLKLIDACEDDGTRIFPAVATIARAAECHERTVQRELRNFEAAGLLMLVAHEGPNRPREYHMDLGVLDQVRERGFDAVLSAARGGADGDASVETARGGAVPPLPEGGADVTPGVALDADRGDNECHPTPPYPSDYPSIERESADEGGQARDPASPEHPTGMAEQRPKQAKSAEPKAPEPKPEDDREFLAAVAAWRTGGTDNRRRAFLAWLTLSAEERAAAVARMPAFEARLRADRRSTTPALATYLAERLWTQIAPAAGAGGAAKMLLPPRGRDWWIVFFRRRAAGERVSVMLDLAKGGTSWGIDVDALPSAEEAAGFAKIERGSDGYRDLERRLAREGLRLGGEESGQWIWVPEAMVAGTALEDAGDGEWR